MQVGKMAIKGENTIWPTQETHMWEGRFYM